MLTEESYSMDTLAIRSGQYRTVEGEHSEPIFATSSFVFDSAAQAAARFSGDQDGNIYSRFTNPTVNAFERRLAAMEGAKFCVATSSGMAAISGLILSALKPGDHVVASREMFGSTVSLFDKVFKRFDISVSLVPVDDLDAWNAAIQSNTRLLFLETPSNPLCRVADVSALATLAKESNAMLAVDNCFCTPVLQRPLELGADVVIHSATKYLDGQGRCVGGAMATNNEEIRDAFFAMLRTTGPSLSPFNAWVFLKGLETLPLRMRQHCHNAERIAHWLLAQNAISEVFYPGFTDHPGHELAKRQQSLFGGIVSFRMKKGKNAAWALIDNTRLLSITANLGDARTTITHPASTTHARITEQQRRLSGVDPSLVRISAGLESASDIIADLGQALASGR